MKHSSEAPEIKQLARVEHQPKRDSETTNSRVPDLPFSVAKNHDVRGQFVNMISTFTVLGFKGLFRYSRYLLPSRR